MFNQRYNNNNNNNNGHKGGIGVRGLRGLCQGLAALTKEGATLAGEGVHAKEALSWFTQQRAG